MMRRAILRHLASSSSCSCSSSLSLQLFFHHPSLRSFSSFSKCTSSTLLSTHSTHSKQERNNHNNHNNNNNNNRVKKFTSFSKQNKNNNDSSSSSSSSLPSSSNNHAMFEEQMRELANERLNLFGSDNDDNDDANPLSFDSYNNNKTLNRPSEMDADELEQLGKDREALFSFEEDEILAWSSGTEKEGGGGGVKHSEELMEQIRVARSERDAALERQKAFLEKQNHSTTTSSYSTDSSSSSSSPPPSSSSFTHLSPTKSGSSSNNNYNATMVDVGNKKITQRVAVAQSIVVFPPEVMEEFNISGGGDDDDDETGNEMVGPKGPIFETAQLAGIMGAKKTQDLIPLCHPLPLNYVNITIRLEDNQAIVQCECRVTHKTGVEMEALTGASIAALTIYDMVKAVSHRVRIEGTTLISKTGGKRSIGPSA